MSDTKDGLEQRTQKTNAVQTFKPFFGNDNHAFLVRKAERLASAVHVVTGFVAKDEPVRHLLREVSLQVVRASIDLERFSTLGHETYAARCAEVAALLETAQAAGLVSAMNAKMIADEYSVLAVFARDRFSSIRARAQDLKDTPPQVQSTVFKGQKDIDSYRTQKRTISDNKGQANNQRRSKILSILEEKKKISIKDATDAVPGVSEKTVQRELLAMVEDGTLIKEGERRWSTYGLAPKG